MTTKTAHAAHIKLEKFPLSLYGLRCASAIQLKTCKSAKWKNKWKVLKILAVDSNCEEFHELEIETHSTYKQ